MNKTYVIAPFERDFKNWLNDNNTLRNDRDIIWIRNREQLLGRTIKPNDSVWLVNGQGFDYSVLKQIEWEIRIRRTWSS